MRRMKSNLKVQYIANVVLSEVRFATLNKELGLKEGNSLVLLKL